MYTNYESMKQDRQPRNQYTHLWSTDLRKVLPRIDREEKISLLQMILEKTS